MLRDDLQRNRPCVAIILLNYNNYQDTIACVETLRRIDYSNWIIVIVDNHSPNTSFAELKKLEEGNIHVIDSGRNGGFAFGNNIGIRYALENGANYVLLLNNDTLVEPDFLSIMIGQGVYQAKGDITTCRIMYNDDRSKVWYAGGDIDWNNLRAIHRKINKTYSLCENKPEEVSFISGCCMMISREFIEQNGMLPEEYFMYYEDMDYCQHARECGAKLVYIPSAVIYHCVGAAGGGADSPFFIEWNARSRRQFYRKYKSNIPWYRRWLVVILCEVRQIISLICKGNLVQGFYAYIRSCQGR